MKLHFAHLRAIFKILPIIIVVCFLQESFARDDLISDRARMISRRNERFYKNDMVRQYVSVSGQYDSKEDTKQYVLKLEHFYKSKKWISDIDLQHQVDYGKGDQKLDNSDQVKKSELYKAIIAQKIVLNETNNYLVLFNETKYNDMSKDFYYDITTAAGVGRMFFDDRLEIDLGYGNSKVKDSNSSITPKDYSREIWVPAFRGEFEIIDGIRLVQRGYAYYSGSIDSYYLNTRLQYPLTRKVYLQLSHIFQKRAYEKYDKKGLSTARVNEVERQILLGFRYDLGFGNF